MNGGGGSADGRRSSGVFGPIRRQPIELHRLGDAVALLDAASDLRCVAGTPRAVGRVQGFERSGVVVSLLSGDGALTCSVTTSEDVARGPQQRSLSFHGAQRQPSWVAWLVTDRRPWVAVDLAAGMVAAELSRYEHVRLDHPPEPLGIFEAPPSITQAGELTAFALRAVGCQLGAVVRERPPVEHPDMYLD